MTPSACTERAPEREVAAPAQDESIVLERPKNKSDVSKPVVGSARKFEGSFQSSMLELNRMKSGSKTTDFLISLALNLALLAGPAVAGLCFTDTINLKQYASTFLVAPPPPPPPPPAPAVVSVKAPPAHKVFENAGKLLAPTAIPEKVAEIKEAPLPPDVEGFGGVPGGVPGGVAGGSMGGVLGGVIGGVKPVATPVVPKEVKRAPIRVGGHVREPQVIKRVEPAYPALARQTHMQGVVLIDAILDEHGNVVELKVVSGPVLLIQAALDAVRQWKYEPTYLNDEPVAVQMNIIVTFQLSQ